MNQLELGGVEVGTLTRVLSDGSLVVAKYNGSVPTVITFAPPEEEEAEVELDLWIPRGIIVTPAENGVPGGWGLPALTPGVNPGPLAVHWSENGALPQVLLSLLGNAGYPDDPAQSLPLYWDDFEAPDDDIDPPTEGPVWAAYRIRFRNLGPAFDAVLEEINARRDPDEPLCAPFAGYADIAVEYARVVSIFGTDESTYPIGARTNFRRTEKEGTVKTNGTDAANGQLGAGNMPPGLSVGDIVDALVTVQPTLVDDTFECGTSFSLVGVAPFFTALIDHTDQWIHAGNIDWLSIHEEIPRLSWLGSRGRSIPTWELATGVVTTTTYNGTLNPTAVFLSNWLDTASTNFQGATLEQFGRCIYARGRILAQLPNNGIVLGAAIQRIDATDTVPVRYLLFAIGWHRADQKLAEAGSPTLDPNAPLGVYWDSTSDIRVWMAELPTRRGLACAPEYVVDGIFDETTNPRGWTDKGRHRLSTIDPAGFNNWLGDFPDRGTEYPTDAEFGAPKGYWQTWMFNGSGTEATCTRSATYVQRHPISHALFFTGPVGPVQAIRCQVDEDTSVVAIVWQTPLGVIFDVGQRLPYAWDYAGDDLAVAWFGGPVGDETGGELRIEDTHGNALVSWHAFGNPSSMAHAYDARTNTGILAAYTFSGSLFTVDDLTVFHASAIKASVSAWIDPGVGVGFAGWGNGFTYMTAPQWNQVHGNVPTLPAIAVYGDDFIAAIWDGSVPGGPAGTGPFVPETVFVRVAALTVSSIDDIDTLLDFSNGWLNFAGVC